MRPKTVLLESFYFPKPDWTDCWLSTAQPTGGPTYMRVEAVVSQQSHKVDDLVDVLVVIGFVGDKHPPCVQETPMIGG